MNKTELLLRTKALTNEYITCALYSFDQKYIICVTGDKTTLILKTDSTCYLIHFNTISALFKV